MTTEHAALWERIAAFNIDGADHNALPFAARLARENGWTRAFAERVIGEYKRYVFLCLTAGQPMCPSEQVDQAWHLHLTYTRSYWHRFCKEVLGQPLHHEPTQGGATEAAKHLAMYANTLAAYQRAFGQSATTDCWPPAEQRFGSDLAERRVNVRQYWLLPKALVKQVAVACTMFMACATLVVGCDAQANPFATKGTHFLPYYIVAFVGALVVARLVRRHYRQPLFEADEPLPELDTYETAYLAGGLPRVQAVTLVHLKDQGNADFDRTGKVRVHHALAPTSDLVDSTVYAELSRQANKDFQLKPVGKALNAIERTRFGRLEQLGLRTPAESQFVGRFFPLVVMSLPVVLLGGPRFWMGLQNNKPVSYLLVTMILGVVISLFVFLQPLRRSRKGDGVLARLKAQHDDAFRKLNPASAGVDIIPAVALFGTVALAGTSYAYMRSQMKPLDNNGAGGCSSSSGCGSGGCSTSDGGGGGCGGCGGGD